MMALDLKNTSGIRRESPSMLGIAALPPPAAMFNKRLVLTGAPFNGAIELPS
jgi:hypothetical protein